ncbi:MAG: hypothetical protein FWC38_00150 [Proteobacteria bacterium]|nr:hypothetical protein [Pseudomonadota bacterium]MCL2306654.1 hypothetical protein [Pseudomonadota bacterium]
MNATWQRATVISILFGFAGFGLLLVFATVLWWAYPYPENASQQEIEFVWAIHTLAEKLFGFLVVALCAVGAAAPLRRTWRMGLGAAIGSGLVYQGVAIITYISKFGFSAYLENHLFWSTVAVTVAVSAVFGLIVIRNSCRCDHHKTSTKTKSMSVVKPRILPRSLRDASLSLGVFVIQFTILLILPALFLAVFVSLLSGALCVIAIYLLFLLFTVKEIRVTNEGLHFIRLAGSPRRIRWSEVSSITKVTSREIILRGWLWPPFPAREMTLSFTAEGHYRIAFNGKYIYYPPADTQQFEALLSAHLRYGKTMQPKCADAHRLPEH